MPRIECGRGHIYDSDIYPSCPYCKGASKEIDLSIPNSNEAIPEPGYRSVSDSNATQAPVGYGERNADNSAYRPPSPTGKSIMDDNETLPPTGYGKKIKRVDEENPTTGVMKEKFGLNPVVGWLVCVQGKEIGKDYRLFGQINTIGRGDSMDVCIKGDNTISNKNHARLSYSEKNNRFHLIPAESKNIILVNGEEVFSPTILNAYDVIDFGKSQFIFVPFCSENFKWNKYIESEEA